MSNVQKGVGDRVSLGLRNSSSPAFHRYLSVPASFQPGAVHHDQRGRHLHALPERDRTEAGLHGDQAVHRGQADHAEGEPATGQLSIDF